MPASIRAPSCSYLHAFAEWNARNVEKYGIVSGWVILIFIIVNVVLCVLFASELCFLPMCVRLCAVEVKDAENQSVDTGSGCGIPEKGDVDTAAAAAGNAGLQSCACSRCKRHLHADGASTSFLLPSLDTIMLPPLPPMPTPMPTQAAGAASPQPPAPPAPLAVPDDPLPHYYPTHPSNFVHFYPAASSYAAARFNAQTGSSTPQTPPSNSGSADINASLNATQSFNATMEQFAARGLERASTADNDGALRVLSL